MKAGWRVVPLGEVIELISGQHIDAKEYNTSGRGIGYLTGPSDFGVETPIISKWTESPKRFAEPGDILLTVKGSGVGKINRLRQERVAISRQIMAVRPKGIDPDFLFLLMASLSDHFAAQATGAAIPGISREHVTDLLVPLPPLDEQKRIVTVLDDVFQGLSRARANAEANLADARELFVALTSDAFLSSHKGWREVALGDVADFRNGLNFTRASKGQRLKIVGVGDFQNNLEVPVDDLAEVVIDGKLAQDDHLRSGDILAVRSNGNKTLIGRVMMVPETKDIISFSGFTIRIRLKAADILPDYLLQFMRSPKVRETLTAGGGGSNISNLNQGQLSRLRVSFPSKDDQRQILEKINSATEAINNLRQQFDGQSRDLTTLRQSLLQKAFSGELT